MFSINDFLEYANPGNVPTASSRQQTTKQQAFKSVPAPRPVTAPKKAAIPVVPTQPVKRSIELVNYSERSFAIFGDTKPLQAQLESLGGKFNRWLKREGVATPGYIFSIGRIDKVRKALDL